MATKFNDPAIKFNVLSGQINHYRWTVELAVGVDEAKAKRGLWLKLNSAGQLEELSGGTGSLNCFQLLEPSTQSDVGAYPYDLQGNARGGQMAVVTGSYIGEVGENAWESSLGTAAFAPQTLLKVNDDGQLAPAAVGDIVVAVSLGVQENNMLKYTTHGGNVKRES